MDSLEQQITGLGHDLKSWKGRFDSRLDSFESRMDAMDVKWATRDGTSSGLAADSLARTLWDSPEFSRMRSVGRGTALIKFDKSLRDFVEFKTTLTSDTVGFPTPGVMPVQRVGSIVQPARRAPAMRDLLTSIPVGVGMVDFVKVSADVTKASPVTEGDTKPETGMTFTTESERVRTIALWIPASKQLLEDYTQLAVAINSALASAVRLEEDRQILFGDNTGENLNGITLQAQAFDVTILTASDGYEYPDIIAGACAQIAADDELAPNFVALNPQDWWKIRRTKDSTGQYIFGDPSQPDPNNLFGLQVVPTTGMTIGKFLVGNSTIEAAAVYERQATVVEISTEHAEYFTKNLVAIRAESRLALCTFRPNAFVYGNLTQSPA